MGKPVERHHLRIIENSDEDLEDLSVLRSDIKSLMEKKHASIRYNHSSGYIETISFKEILDSSMPPYALEEAFDQLVCLKYRKGNYPTMIHVYQNHPPRLVS